MPRTVRPQSEAQRALVAAMEAHHLTLALGRPGRPNSGFGCLTGQGNGQGGREHGQKADQLPGYRKLDNPVDRLALEAFGVIRPAARSARGPQPQQLTHRRHGRTIHSLPSTG